ncbi:hypothetical protein [Saccharopolyspora taberi]|uniref:WXG100 family type VII secretion target n=1 Tax=Saccharopolyspora taberi TaxID=60895 RepID=A0ABN3VLQ1_9PSEU
MGLLDSIGDAVADFADFPALGFNPAPGDAASAADAAAVLSNVAEQLAEVGPVLDNQLENWTGDAGDGYRQMAEMMQRRLAGRLQAVETVHQALLAWSGELAANREHALRLEREAQAAKRELASKPPVQAAMSPESGAQAAAAQQALDAIIAQAKELLAGHEARAAEVARAIRGTEPLLETSIGASGNWIGGIAEWFTSNEEEGIPKPSDPAPRDWAENPGSGPWGAREPTWQDYVTSAKFNAMAGAADAMGYTNAARHMEHYLTNTGEPLQVDPGLMLRDSAGFRENLQEELAGNDEEWRKRAVEEFNRNGGQPTRIPVETQWKSHSFDQETEPDWYYASGSMHYKVTGAVEVTPSPGGEPNVEMKYKVHVEDPYNWDKGKGVDIFGTGVADVEPGTLHQTGLAREYQLSGSSDVMHRPVGDGSAPPIEPPAGDRDGGRTDPTR